MADDNSSIIDIDSIIDAQFAAALRKTPIPRKVAPGMSQIAGQMAGQAVGMQPPSMAGQQQQQQFQPLSIEAGLPPEMAGQAYQDIQGEAKERGFEKSFLEILRENNISNEGAPLIVRGKSCISIG